MNNGGAPFDFAQGKQGPALPKKPLVQPSGFGRRASRHGQKPVA